MNPKQKKAAYIVGAVIGAWLLYAYVKGRQQNPADQLQPDQGQFGIPGAPIAGAYWTGGGGASGPTPGSGPSPTWVTDKWSIDPATGHPRPIPPFTKPINPVTIPPANPVVQLTPNALFHTDVAHPNLTHDAMPHLEPAGQRGAPLIPFPNFITVGGTAGGVRR